MTPLLIKCWTVLRPIVRPHRHIKRIGHHIAAHKSLAAIPVIVCASVGGGWLYPAPALAPSAPPFAAAPGNTEFIPLELGPEFFSPTASIFGGAPPAGFGFTPPAGFGFTPPGTPSALELSPSLTPAAMPVEQVPEPASLMLFGSAIGLLYVLKRAAKP